MVIIMISFAEALMKFGPFGNTGSDFFLFLFLYNNFVLLPTYPFI